MRYQKIILLAGSFLFGVSAHAVTEINYWMWDQNQPPAYRACADAFEKQNPDIKIKITQTGWFDHWNALNAAFVSGTAPDVISDHLARYPEFVQNNLLVDLAPVSAFVSEATEPNVTFLFPITDHASEVLRITRAALDAIFLNGADAASTLKSANQEVNALFE